MSGRRIGGIAVVTGGASGIGAACCRLLAEAGAKIVVLDRDEAPAHAIAAEVNGKAWVADVGDERAGSVDLAAGLGDGRRLVRGRRSVRPFVKPCQPHVENLDRLPGIQQQIRRLDVAVHNSLGMRGVECIGNLDAEVEQTLQFQRTSKCEFPKGPALQILHHDERPALVLADLMDGTDVRMI